MNKSIKGSLMLMLTALIWGTTFVAQSIGMDHIDPFTFNFSRTMIGAIILIPIIAAFRTFDSKSKGKTSLKNTITGGILCGIILFIASSFQQSGISLTTAGKAGFITALYIVIVPVFEFILYKKTSPKIWCCAIIAVIGFYLLCIKEGSNVGKGDLLVLVCAVFFAGHIMVIDFFGRKNTDGMLMSCIQFFTAAVLLFICMLLYESPDIKSIAAAWRPILYAGILSCGVAYTLQIIGQKYTPPAAATLIMSLESVFAALAGWLILKESLSLKELIGCSLVFSAVILSQSPNTAKENKRNIERNVP